MDIEGDLPHLHICNQVIVVEAQLCGSRLHVNVVGRYSISGGEGTLQLPHPHARGDEIRVRDAVER
eukprot:5728495-Heterocapsa_arctica.AAC.1